MKGKLMSIQNIMNVCFAICITLLIYQNTQLKDEIETVKGFSQLDVDKTFDRLDAIDEYLLEIKEYSDEVTDAINNNHDWKNAAFEEIQRLDKNDLILKENDARLEEKITNIEGYMLRNFGNSDNQ